MARVGAAPGSSKPLTIYLPPEVWEALKETAWQERTSASAWAAHVVKVALEKRQERLTKKDAQLELDTAKKVRK